MSEMNEMKEIIRKRPLKTVSMNVGSFPDDLYAEWDNDCKRRFGNCRWMKIWYDHMAATNVGFFMERFEELNDRISNLENIISSKNNDEDKKIEIKTFGRGE